MACFSSTRRSKKREQYLATERKIIDLSQRAWSNSADRPTVSTFDTEIPSMCVSPHGRGCCLIDGRCASYKIHGISVSSSNQLQGKESTPVVLLHGYGNSAAFFYRTWNGLSMHFSTIYALDWLVFGASSRPNFHSQCSTTSAEDFFVESLEAWREAMDIDKMILVGHSLGGYLAVAYMERYPRRVHANRPLFLMSPVGIPQESTEVLMLRRQLRRSNLQNFAWHCAVENIVPYVTFGCALRSLPKKLANYIVLPQYADRYRSSIADPFERLLVAELFYSASLLPGSGERCLCRILNAFLYARKPLTKRIPKVLRQGNQSALCSIYYGDRDWMDVGGGLAVQQECEAVGVYQIRQSGHMILLDNPVEFVNGMVNCFFPEGGKLLRGHELPISLDIPYPIKQKRRVTPAVCSKSPSSACGL